MATIGTFTKTNDGFTGTIQTVGLKATIQDSDSYGNDPNPPKDRKH